MARTANDIVKEQLGTLMTELAILSSQLETANERIKELEAQLPKPKEEKK